MLTTCFPMLRKTYRSASYSNYLLHFAAAEGNADFIRELITKGANIYEPVKDGETALHVAIFNDQETVCDILLGEYEKDFLRVEEYFRHNWSTTGEDKFWFKKQIALACTEQECKQAEEFENVTNGEYDKSDDVEVIFLSTSSQSKRIAAVRVTESNRKNMNNYLERIRHNGYLSWNYCGAELKCDTLLQLVASKGNVELMRRLIVYGADPAYPGRNQRTPLMEACKAMKICIVKLLLEEYCDMLDPTVEDHLGYSALTYTLEHDNASAFDYVLKKMISFRKEKFLETDSVAFNQIFRFKHNRWPEVSIWSFTSEKSRDTFLEQYLKQYSYDLSFQSGDRIMLMEVIIRHTAKSYYQEEIRKNPELLGLTDPEGCNVLHCLLWSDELDFVKEFYQSRLDQCRTLFENEDGAVICLASVISHENCQVLIFLLEQHLEFIRTIADTMMDNFYEEDMLPSAMFEEPINILLTYLPELEKRVEELMYKVMEEEIEEDIFCED
ncbi:uncharacterized protein LOC131436807 [Malaya genurostris]|uniref:uncharacterized protein LOC131436807 n=1 Tax=Malaya genurostris TaxID=325434 RepID=UPI0026F37F12|nr:uncharacterized protein LOC131436807 [Malaya genurostris]